MRYSLRTCSPMVLATLMLGAACMKDSDNNVERTAPAALKPADNTKMNERDRGPSITPIDQGNTADDLNITQQIRKAVMADDSLSMDAKNAKIITANGVITLRGPVRSEEERKSLEAKAAQFAGTNRVENQLDVAVK